MEWSGVESGRLLAWDLLSTLGKVKASWPITLLYALEMTCFSMSGFFKHGSRVPGLSVYMVLMVYSVTYTICEGPKLVDG